MSGVEVGGFAATARLSDGGEFAVRVMSHDEQRGLWMCRDARGIVWWRTRAELTALPPGDPREAEFLTDEPEAGP